MENRNINQNQNQHNWNPKLKPKPKCFKIKTETNTIGIKSHLPKKILLLILVQNFTFDNVACPVFYPLHPFFLKFAFK